MVLSHWFLPDKDTHQKAHFLSWHGLLIYILIFMLLQVGFSVVSYSKPGVLGITGNIDTQKLIELTNQERVKQGLAPVVENSALDQAAQNKAANMFLENYWAHFAPSGKTPWDFILSSGYKFTYAGENLAKNFYSSDDVVKAWMNSQTHRENLLNPKYEDIGMAVVEGNLNGQKTVLVVQEFGTTQNLAANPAVAVAGKQITLTKEDYNNKPILLASTVQTAPTSKPLIDPYFTYKTIGFSMILLMTILLGIDIIVLRRRGVLRISSHNIAHMAILSVTAASLITISPGSIL